MNANVLLDSVTLGNATPGNVIQDSANQDSVVRESVYLIFALHLAAIQDPVILVSVFRDSALLGFATLVNVHLVEKNSVNPLDPRFIVGLFYYIQAIRFILTALTTTLFLSLFVYILLL